MAFFLHGVHVPHRKNTANISPERMTDVKTVILPVSMHIGAPAKPIVKFGDKVEKGQLIAEAVNGLSVNIHASISGLVIEADDKHIVIKAD